MVYVAIETLHLPIYPNKALPVSVAMLVYQRGKSNGKHTRLENPRKNWKSIELNGKIGKLPASDFSSRAHLLAGGYHMGLNGIYPPVRVYAYMWTTHHEPRSFSKGNSQVFDQHLEIVFMNKPWKLPSMMVLFINISIYGDHGAAIIFHIFRCFWDL